MRWNGLAILLMVSAAGAANAVTLFSPDEFTGGNEGWFGGQGPGAEPGGPGGPADSYLLIQGFGGGGAGSRPGAYSQEAKWTGNYLTAGVTGIRLWLRNQGASSMSVRLVLFDGTDTRWTSTNAMILDVGGPWQLHTFSISSTDLTRVQGSSTLSESLADITKIMVRHQVGAPNANGTAAVGAFGIDKVEAVPEPASLIGLAMGALALRKRTKRIAKG